MNPIKTKLIVKVQCDSKDGVGSFLEYIEPVIMKGEQYGDTY